MQRSAARQDFYTLVHFGYEVLGKGLSQINHGDESVVELDYSFDVAAADLPNQIRHRLHHVVAHAYHFGCAVDYQPGRPAVDPGDYDPVIGRRSRSESAKPLS